MKVKIEGSTVNLANVKRVGCISTARDGGKAYHSINVWFKNGKRKFIQSMNHTLLKEFMNKAIFYLHKSEIKEDLQKSF